MLVSIFALVLGVFIINLDSANAHLENPSVLLANVKSLTLRRGLETAHRRVEPVPQLRCAGGNAQGLYEVDIMHCRNAASSPGEFDVKWTCTASLPPYFKLGSTDVSCEGYQSARDPLILKGSCGVEYRLLLTTAGEEKYGDHLALGDKDDAITDRSRAFTILFWTLFIAATGSILYHIFRDPRRPTYTGQHSSENNDDDAFPPDDTMPHNSHELGTQKNFTRDSLGGSSIGSMPTQNALTGAVAGIGGVAYAAYLTGRRNNIANPNHPEAGQAQEEWLERTRRRAPVAGPSNARRSSPSATDNFVKYEGTGFGGSNRR